MTTALRSSRRDASLATKTQRLGPARPAIRSVTSEGSSRADLNRRQLAAIKARIAAKRKNPPSPLSEDERALIDQALAAVEAR